MPNTTEKTLQKHCTHYYEIDKDAWTCLDCGKHTLTPWTSHHTPKHSHHTWTPSLDNVGWASCEECGISTQCDHNYGYEDDTVETPYMGFAGVSYHTYSGRFCTRCGIDERTLDEDSDDDEPEE